MHEETTEVESFFTTIGPLADALSDALVAADAGGTILYANAASERLLGWDPGTLAGQPVSAIVAPGLRGWLPAGSAAARRTLAPLAGRRLNVHSLHRSGRELPTELLLTLLEVGDQPVAVATLRRRGTQALSRWSDLTVSLFETLAEGEEGRSTDQRLLEVLGRQLGWALTTLWALGPGDTLTCRTVWTDPAVDPAGRLAAARGPDVAAEVNIPQHVLATGAPLWVPDLGADPRFADGPAARTGLASVVAFPIRAHGTVMGVIELMSPTPVAADPGVVDLVQAVSGPAGALLTALEHSAERERLVHELETARRYQAFVLEASAVVSDVTSYPTMLERLAQVAVPVLADLCMIDVVEPDGAIRRMACHHADPDKADLAAELHRDFAPDPYGRHPVAEVVQRGESRWSGEMTDEFLAATTKNARHLEVVRQLGFTSYMAVPLVTAGKVLGTVTLVSAGSGRRFRSEDLTWAEQLAIQVSSGIERTRRYERELEISHALQRNLLPSGLPEVDGATLAARYLPATREAAVGGDWYDVVPTAGRLAVVVGDVEGHDMRAAAVMAKLRNPLALLLGEGEPPGRALVRLNEFSLRAGLNRLATVLVAVLDLGSSTLTLASAGHPPPFWVGPPAGDQDRPVSVLGVRPAPPVGVPWTGVEESVHRMAPGVLFLFTDGLVELAARPLEDRLGDLARALATAPAGPHALSDHVLARLVPFAERSDDVATLALEVCGPPRPA